MVKPEHFTDCAKQFLGKYASKVKEKTLKRYERDLTLFYLYLESYGNEDARDLSWYHIEEFFSWWYLRRYTGCSLSGARGIFATLRKFCSWLDEQGIAGLNQTWNQKECRILKGNVERILTWEKEVAVRRSSDSEYWLEQEMEEAEVAEGCFRVINTFQDKGALRDLGDDSAYIVRFMGLISDYIKPGDIISAALCRDDRGLYVNDNIVWFFYPPTASSYIR
ncbi:MAG: hypothetical protein GX318_02850 [Clostridia bacterium]|nr:hypothetical protein [Clostridia bacterium]